MSQSHLRAILIVGVTVYGVALAGQVSKEPGSQPPTAPAANARAMPTPGSAASLATPTVPTEPTVRSASVVPPIDRSMPAPEPPTDPWYLRALLIALSTLSGATTAYFIARAERKADQRRDKIAAGNKALFALIDQFNTLKMIDDQYLSPHRKSPTRWIDLRPVHGFPPPLHLSSADLGFLVRPGADATLLLRLHEAERNTDLALQALAIRSDFHQAEVRPRLAQALESIPSSGMIPLDKIQAALGEGTVLALKERTDNVYALFAAAKEANEFVLRALQRHLATMFPRATFLDRQIEKTGLAPSRPAA